MAAEVPAEVETPVAFVPKDSSETLVNVTAGTVSSPISNIATVSDLASTGLGEEIEHNKEQTATRSTSKMETWRLWADTPYSGFIPRSPRFPPPTSATCFLR